MSKLFNIPEANLEEWRDIEGFEGLYKVSNFGRVKGLDRITSDGKHIKGKILSPQGPPNSHLIVMLWKEGKEYNCLLHRLVAKAFIPNVENLSEVNHIDNNPANNKVSNLEWASSSGNSMHRILNGNSKCRSKQIKCLEDDVTYPSLSAAGRSVEASTQQVIDSINSRSCCKGKTFVYADDLPEDIEAYLEQAHAKYQNFHKRPNMPNCRKVQIIETGQIFDSIAAASRFLQCDSATVSNRIKAGKSFNGVTLQFVE